MNDKVKCDSGQSSIAFLAQEVHSKLEATAAKLRASQEGAARELVEQQVGRD